MISDNDVIVTNGNAFISSAVCPGVSGERSFLQLWNPANSGVMGYCDRLTPSNSAAASNAWDLRPSEVSLGGTQTTSWSKNLGGTPGKLLLQQGSAVANTLPHFNDGRMREYWLNAASIDRPNQMFVPAIAIPPGHGILLVTAYDGNQTIASFEWREYLLTP